jgi:L-lactate dehydrogenase complex protein LldG
MTELSARGEILGRIRTAIADVPHDEPAAWDPALDDDPAAAYARLEHRGSTDDAARLFAERCSDYRATVVRCAHNDTAIGAAVSAACARHNVGSLVLPVGLPSAWVPPAVSARYDDPPLSFAELDATDGVLTACAHAIAITGTIVLDAGPGQGRRAITLISDLHICVVRAAQIYVGVPESVQALATTVRASRAPVTLISGPSATSDIELQRVEGVHGPRRLEVVLAG